MKDTEDRDQKSEVSDSALNRLIAEALGYTNVEYNYDRAYHTCDIGELGYHWLVGEKFGVDEILPNYCQDLNACAEMEKTLQGDEVGDYYFKLVCDTEQLSAFATARQRAEAFAKVKGLI